MDISLSRLQSLAGIKHPRVNGYTVRPWHDVVGRPSSVANGLATDLHRRSLKVDYTVGDIVLEAESWAFDDDHRGGTIVFSTDVNAVLDDGKGWYERFKNKIKQFTKSWNNRVSSVSKTQNAINRVNNKLEPDSRIQGISVGRMFKGRYVHPETSKVYDEHSMAVDVAGVISSVLLDFATEIAREFEQNEVMVKDANDGRIYFADRN